MAFGIGLKEMQNKKSSDFIKKFHLNRVEKRVKARIIMHPTTKPLMKKFENLKYYKYKYSKVEFPTNIAVWKDNVVTLVWSDSPIAFVIKSKEVATKYKKYFNHI